MAIVRSLPIANDNMPQGVVDARKYLEAGGLGEVMMAAWSARGFFDQVSCDTDTMVALTQVAT